MKPGGPPPQHVVRHVTHHVFTALPPRLAQKIRLACTLLGVLSMPLSVVVGILIVWVRYQLPAATVGTTLFTVIMGGLAAFFHFFSGVTLVVGRSFVKSGYLNATSATNARRVLVTLWFGTAVTTGLAVLLFTGAVNASKNWSVDKQFDSAPSVVGYLVLLLVPVVLSTVNVITSWRLLRPTAELLRKYDHG